MQPTKGWKVTEYKIENTRVSGKCDLCTGFILVAIENTGLI